MNSKIIAVDFDGTLWMPSLEGIAYIIQKEVKEKKSND